MKRKKKDENLMLIESYVRICFPKKLCEICLFVCMYVNDVGRRQNNPLSRLGSSIA